MKMKKDDIHLGPEFIHESTERVGTKRAHQYQYRKELLILALQILPTNSTHTQTLILCIFILIIFIFGCVKSSQTCDVYTSSEKEASQKKDRRNTATYDAAQRAAITQRKSEKRKRAQRQRRR